jgi:hypothetical protein
MDMRTFVESYLGEPRSRGNKWWSWHCQVNRPDSNPSLKVESNGFKCFSCGAYATREGKSAPEAVFLVKELGWSWHAAFTTLGSLRERPVRPQPRGIVVGVLPPSVEWRKVFGERVQLAQWVLDDGRFDAGLAFLLGRKYKEATWVHFGVGYSPAWREMSEFDTWLAEGVVFPALVNVQLWSVEVRCLSGSGLKYHRPKGGTEPTPFGVSQLAGKDTLVICEGALDAMAAWQVCEGEVDVIGLRGAANSLGVWEQFLPHPRKILALDADDAGDTCAERLLLSHPTWERRRPPEGRDLGDMLKEGTLSRSWLLQEVKL